MSGYGQPRWHAAPQDQLLVPIQSVRRLKRLSAIPISVIRQVPCSACIHKPSEMSPQQLPQVVLHRQWTSVLFLLRGRHGMGCHRYAIRHAISYTEGK
jgi:hypothetical protein